MTVAAALSILSAINTLINIMNGLPGVADKARGLLEEVRPYVHELGVDVATEFVATEQRLQGT